MTTSSSRFARLRRWLWARKGRVGATLCATALSGYGVTYAAVTLRSSPTDRSVTLPDGRSLAYRVAQAGDGTGPRVILVHGSPADASSWDRLLATSEDTLAGLEVIAIDRLGYGNSTPGAELSLRVHAQSLEPLLTRETILVGHSYGGPVALRAAAAFPDRVLGLVLVAGACDPRMQDAQTTRALIDGLGRAVPEPWAVSNRELLALTDENRGMTPVLPLVRCPVITLHGTWDPVCPHDGTVSFLETSLPSAASVETRSLARTGHNIQLSQPDEIARAIVDLTR